MPSAPVRLQKVQGAVQSCIVLFPRTTCSYVTCCLAKPLQCNPWPIEHLGSMPLCPTVDLQRRTSTRVKTSSSVLADMCAVTIAAMRVKGRSATRRIYHLQNALKKTIVSLTMTAMAREFVTTTLTSVRRQESSFIR